MGIISFTASFGFILSLIIHSLISATLEAVKDVNAKLLYILFTCLFACSFFNLFHIPFSRSSVPHLFTCSSFTILFTHHNYSSSLSSISHLFTCSSFTSLCTFHYPFILSSFPHSPSVSHLALTFTVTHNFPIHPFSHSWPSCLFISHSPLTHPSHPLFTAHSLCLKPVLMGFDPGLDGLGDGGGLKVG